MYARNVKVLNRLYAGSKELISLFMKVLFAKLVSADHF